MGYLRLNDPVTFISLTFPSLPLPDDLSCLRITVKDSFFKSFELSVKYVQSEPFSMPSCDFGTLFLC